MKSDSRAIPNGSSCQSKSPESRSTSPPIESRTPQTIDDGFEQTPVGQRPALAVADAPQAGASVQVTDETAATGKRCLKLTDAPDLKYTWQPHMYYQTRHRKGTAHLTFAVRLDQGSRVHPRVARRLPSLSRRPLHPYPTRRPTPRQQQTAHKNPHRPMDPPHHRSSLGQTSHRLLYHDRHPPERTPETIHQPPRRLPPMASPQLARLHQPRKSTNSHLPRRHQARCKVGCVSTHQNLYAAFRRTIPLPSERSERGGGAGEGE